METTEVFLTFVVSSGTALILAILKMCYKSKCSQVEICCIRITRNTEVEERADELELTNNQNEKSENKNEMV